MTQQRVFSDLSLQRLSVVQTQRNVSNFTWLNGIPQSITQNPELAFLALSVPVTEVHKPKGIEFQDNVLFSAVSGKYEQKNMFSQSRVLLKSCQFSGSVYSEKHSLYQLMAPHFGSLHSVCVFVEWGWLSNVCQILSLFICLQCEIVHFEEKPSLELGESRPHCVTVMYNKINVVIMSALISVVSRC